MFYFRKYKKIIMLFILFQIVLAVKLYANEYFLATYNIRCLETSDKINGNDWSNRVENICNLVLFNDFDVFGIQEANDSQLQDIVKYVGKEYSFTGVGCDDGLKKGAINAILFKKNKFEVIESNTFWLSDTPEKISKGWDGRFYRTCSWVKLLDKTSKDTIYFFNTHLDAGGKIAREKSCELILEQIKKISNGENAILVGDFNSLETDNNIKTLISRKYLFDAYELAKYRWMPNGTYNAFNPLRISSKRLDHIFVTKNINVSRYGIINAFYYITDGKVIKNYKRFPYGPKNIQLHIPSDHYPLCCKISIDSVKY